MKRVLFLVGLVVLLWGPGSALADEGRQTTLLLSPSGQLVGGVWQQWLNDSYMPTYNGSMTFALGTSPVCFGNALGCTGNDAFTPGVVAAQGQLPETAANLDRIPSYTSRAFAEQWMLLYEQGHVIDYNYLTDSDRLRLLRLWGISVPAGEPVSTFWWQGEFATAGDPPVMGEWFAQMYSLCALYPRWSWRTVLDEGGVLVPIESPGTNLPIIRAGHRVRWKPNRKPVTEKPTRLERTAVRIQAQTCALIRRVVPAT